MGGEGGNLVSSMLMMLTVLILYLEGLLRVELQSSWLLQIFFVDGMLLLLFYRPIDVYCGVNTVSCVNAESIFAMLDYQLQ